MTLAVIIFLVHLGLHQDSVLIFLLFIIVLGVLSREMRSVFPKKVLYTDDWALANKPLEDLKERKEA